MHKHLIFFILLAHAAAVAPCQSGNLTVVIIRHGEKNESNGNLSCQGMNRAIALPAVLHKKFPGIGAIYIPSVGNGKSMSHTRMLQTATPFAVQQNLSLNSKYAYSDDKGIAAEVMKRSGVVLLVWEHGNIPAIAEDLGVKKVPGWNGDDYDSIWIISYGESKKGNLKASLEIDHEGLKPSSTCN
ncbi:MAG: histidine phosphatase family protein [Chitinophagaceae bacterium]|nr:histidine phosphatase family protein [Chitinophagaceae bacterium]